MIVEPPALTILIVEDDADLSQIVAEAMRRDGHRAVVARDGASALRDARACKPDAVLLDLGLPDGIGYDIAHALRQDEILSETAVIVVVTGDADADHDRAMAVGVDVLLHKPVTCAALADLVAYLHARRRKHPRL